MYLVSELGGVLVDFTYGKVETEISDVILYNKQHQQDSRSSETTA